MVTFCGWVWRDKPKGILQKQSLGRVLQKKSQVKISNTLMGIYLNLMGFTDLFCQEMLTNLISFFFKEYFFI